MTFPPDGTMLILLGMWTGRTLDAEKGELRLDLAGGPAVVKPEALDELEARGWVEITEAGARVTERGVYALNKWVEARARRQGHRGNIVLKSARVSAAGRD